MYCNTCKHYKYDEEVDAKLCDAGKDDICPASAADPLTIQRGDKVYIVDGKNNWREGIVSSATNYGTDNKPDWYIELDAGKVYWKQGIDGGYVTKISGEKSGD